MKFEPELVQRLAQGKYLSRVVDPKGFALELPTDKGVFMARINSEQLTALYKQAKAGDVEAMYVISTLYDVGIGVPLNANLAANWASFCILQGGTISFKDATRKLKTDIANSINAIGDGFAYSADYVKAIESFKSFLSFGIYDEISTKKGANIRVAPFLSGVHVAACYKKVKGQEEWVLYDMWTLEENKMLPMYSHFASRLVPAKLSQWLNGSRITNSNTVGISGNFVFVYGTLAVRKDKIPALRENLPLVKSARTLLDIYLASDVVQASPDNAALPSLKTAYSRAKKVFDKTGDGKQAYRLAKAAYRKGIADHAAQIASFQAKQPTTYLDFVAYDMVGYSKGSLLYLTDIATRSVKLQSTAFIPTTVRGYSQGGLPAITSMADFRKHHKEIFKHLNTKCPYKLMGLEVLQLDSSAMNAPSRIVYRVKE